jgi:hypothetical protein
MAGNEGQDGSGRRPLRLRYDAFSEDRKHLFLVALRRGDNVLAACALVGISNRTAYRHRERNPDFARDWGLACRMSKTPLELIAFERGVAGTDEPVYRYGRFSHTRRRLSDGALMKLLAAEQPEKYGRAAGLGPLVEGLEGRIDERVAAEVAALGETLREEIMYFVTRLFDRLLTALVPPVEGRGGKDGAQRRRESSETSPNPAQP